jgi:predicted homoserine dehydrogenase-like protein
MIIVDKALQERANEDNPIRVGMIGAGFMGKGVAKQLLTVVHGIELVVISNRTVEKARQAFQDAGVRNPEFVTSAKKVNQLAEQGRHGVTDDPFILCEADRLDAIVEITGAVEFGAQVALQAIKHRKHFITMNAELDGTVGPILNVRAEREGVLFTGADGDQPGVTMNLYRFVKGIGVMPVLCGNIKGLQDAYRNPTTQEGFAKKWGQKPHMVTSFADGTKISFEQAIVANATGMGVGKRGMYGPEVESGTPVTGARDWYPNKNLQPGSGIVDYVVGASPAPGVFVLGMHDDSAQKHYLHLYKLGTGPYYCFYRPYHLCHFEVHNSVARAVLFGDATINALGPPCVEVVATAKKDLAAGEKLDGIGYYMTYGECENADVARDERLLPMGIAEGCKLTRDIKKDEALSYDDVEVPHGRTVDRLRREQDEYFSEIGPQAVGSVAIPDA